jgi:DNA-binding NarL/FixJ family response regulator
MPPATEHPVRVLVVDDHPMVREGLRSMLGGDGVDVAGEAASGAEALRRAAERDVDVVLLDLELPDMDGLAVLRRMREIDARLPVLVVTMHQDPALVRRAVEAGATGYVLKGIGRSELLASIHAVRSGESVFDPGLLKAALADRAATAVAADPPATVALSRVELDLLRLIAAGLTNRQIGQRLRWSHATVKKYVQRVLEKLDVPDRTRAAVEAVRRGLVD